jgi:hypothetical protein
MKRLDMRTRKVLVDQLMERYRRSGKKAKGKLLDEYIALTGYNRCYARRVLRKGHKISGAPGHGPGRKKKYGPDILAAVKKIWGILTFLCGKRLAAAMKETLAALERFKEIRLAPKDRRDLTRISASTLDRLLAPERKRLQIKGRSGTKPGSLLKHKIPIRTFADWDNARPGFLQIDTVGHEGGDARGDFCQSLDMTDVATGWTELMAVKNKAQVWVFEALTKLRRRLPFPLLGINSDSGGEFINAHLFAYCRSNKINFTRSRANKKNDNCWVEQKNYTAVRQTVGYYRYDTPQEMEIINAIYVLQRLYANFFLPYMKLVEKVRDGSKVKKKYDKPKTPYHRVLASRYVKADIKAQLRKQYATLNPAKLRRDMLGLQERLYKLATSKHELWVSKTSAQENLAHAIAV